MLFNQKNIAHHSLKKKKQTVEAYETSAVGRVELHAVCFKVACAGNRSNRND